MNRRDGPLPRGPGSEDQRIAQLERLVAPERAEGERLRAENRELRCRLGVAPEENHGPPPLLVAARSSVAPPPPVGSTGPAMTSTSPNAEKVRLLQELFRGRADVHAVRWESTKGGKGYSPACAREWDPKLCRKPQVKCAACDHRALVPLTEDVLREHLAGKKTVGVYPLLPDDSCTFLAVSFEQVLRKAKARYVLGLTATPTRRDGHHPIVTMQCGPIRFRTDPKKLAAARPFGHVVIPRRLDGVRAGTAEPIQALLARVAAAEARNREIAADVTRAVGEGRACLVLASRLDHLDALAGLLAGRVPHLLSLRGRLAKGEQKAVFEHLLAVPPGEGFAALATGRYIGEGFDEARLDTLFLAAPVAWKGTLQQYAGRLHRLHEGKTEVRIFDYVDEGVPVLEGMFRKRLRGYRAMGYEVRPDPSGGGQGRDLGESG